MSFIQQLKNYLPIWLENGWVTSENVQKILAFHADDSPQLEETQKGSQLISVILSVLAVLLIGGGIISLFAANWASLNRPTRVVVAIFPLVLAQGLLLWGCWKRPNSTAIREGAGLFVALSVGASMGLIGQTYQIDSSLLMFVLTWFFFVLPLGYLVRSWAVMFFSLALIVWLQLLFREYDAFGDDFSQAFQSFCLGYGREVFLLMLIPFLWWQSEGKSYLEQRWIWRTFLCLVLIVYAVLNVMMLFSSYFFSPIYFWVLAGLYYLGAHAFIPKRSVMSTLSAFSLACLLLSMTAFEYLSHESTLDSGISSWDYFLVPLGGLDTLILLVISSIICIRYKAECTNLRIAFVVVGYLFIVVTSLYYIDEHAFYWLTSGVILVFAILYVYRDVTRSLVGVNLAMFWLLSMIAIRFFDGDIPLWLKGTIFLVIGCSILTLNIVGLKKRKTKTAKKVEVIK